MNKIVFNDQTKEVLEPEIHDAELISFSLNDGQVTLKFKGPQKMIIIRLERVRRLSIDEVREQNVVFEIRVVPIQKAPVEDICRALRIGRDDPNRLSTVEKSRTRPLFLFYVDPSVGADIVAACEDISWRYEE